MVALTASDMLRVGSAGTSWLPAKRTGLNPQTRMNTAPDDTSAVRIGISGSFAIAFICVSPLNIQTQSLQQLIYVVLSGVISGSLISLGKDSSFVFMDLDLHVHLEAGSGTLFRLSV